MITFRIRNEVTGKTYDFPLKFNSVDEFHNWTEEHSDEYDNFVDELETTYGVHDFEGDDTEKRVGYSSYEIKSEDYRKVLKLWFDFWIKHKLYGGKIK